MKAIAAHLRYISKNGRLEIEDDQGNVNRGKDALRELAQDWRFGGSLIPDVSPRREAFNVILSMPRGTNPEMLYRAAREFAKSEFADHRYVMVRKPGPERKGGSNAAASRREAVALPGRTSQRRCGAPATGRTGPRQRRSSSGWEEVSCPRTR